MLISVIIPTFNEEKFLPELIINLQEFKQKAEQIIGIKIEQILVDDGSTDKTKNVISKFEGRYIYQKNRGKGNAVRTGVSVAKGDYVVVLDADLEYSPEQIPTLIQPILDGSAAVVFGTRFAKGFPSSMAFPNKLVNFLLAISVRLLFGKKISDEATCYKALRSDVLQAMNLECQRFEFCPEVTAKTFRLGLSIIEVPIDYVARNKKEGKKIRWYDAPEAFWTLLRYRFWKPTQQLQEQSKQSASTHD